MTRRAAVLACAVTAAAVLAGCQGEKINSPGGSNGQLVLSQAQADSIQAVVSSDADALADGDSPDRVSGTSMSPADGGIFAAVQPCRPTRSPNPPVDGDNDRVPDDVLYTFDCVVSRPLVTLITTGTIEVSDPTPATGDLSARHVFTDFFRSRTNIVTGKTWSVKRNGTRTRLGDASSLDFSETGFRSDFVFENGATGSHVKTWTTHFTADTPGSIQADSLPSGLRTISGTSTWTRGTATWSFTASTTTPLHYNADCEDVPRFNAGVLALVVTDKNGNTANLAITYGPACGQVTVTKS
jgi:hypothetical protein